MISRRRFIRMLASSAMGLAVYGVKPTIASQFPHFFFTQLKYKGGQWDPNPFYSEAIVEELELRTSIDALQERRVMDLSDPELFYSPFLYMAGQYEFEPFTSVERDILRRFLTHGGFLFAEDTIGASGFGFDRAFRKEMNQILPNYNMTRLAPDHPVFKSFYLINSFAGRQKIKPYLEGIIMDNWTPVIYSQNDLSGAWSRDRYGNWIHECTPGGESQRKTAFKMGINIVVYSLTSDYKRDVIHHPFIRRRQNI